MIGGVGFISGIISFIWDANEKRAYWLIWMSVIALGIALLIALPSIIGSIRQCVQFIWRTIRNLRDHDDLATERDAAVTRAADLERELGTARARVLELERERDTVDARISDLEAMVDVTVRWQARAIHAEERLGDWNSESIKEGRRRVLGELLATKGPVTFGTPSVFANADNVLIGADLLDGELPAERSLFMVVHEPTGGRAMWLRCLGENVSGTGSIFAPERYEPQGPMTEDDLRDLAKLGAAWPVGYAILAPTSEYIFEKEQ